MEKRSHTWGALEFLINYPTLKLGFKYLQIHTHTHTHAILLQGTANIIG